MTITPARSLKLYLDTSVLNFAISIQDVAKERAQTLRLLRLIEEGRFEGYISEVVFREIDRAPEQKRNELYRVLKGKPFRNLTVNLAIEALARKYMEEGIIPQRYGDDALHVATATVYNLDVLVSWNFEHLVKTKTRREVHGVNTMMGYRFIDIATPTEVIGDEGTTTHA